MEWLKRIWHRLLFYFRREEFDGELEEEMRFHMEMKIQENLEAGMSPEEARYAALLRAATDWIRGDRNFGPRIRTGPRITSCTCSNSFGIASPA